MARWALCAVGLALTVPNAVAEYGPLAAVDATALFQLKQAQALDEQREKHDEQGSQWEVPGGLPDEVGYAPEDFEQGETIEAKAKSGQWLPCVVRHRSHGDLWDLHVSDEFPGFDLPAVPAQLLRRRLGPNQTDWYVDNTQLNHKGHGIMYRRSKNLKDSSEAIAPWNTLVVGSDEEDGWLKTSQGYLPMHVKGVPVLSRRERPEDSSVAISQEASTSEPTLTFEDSEKVQFRTKSGEWYPAEVIAPGKYPNTYSVVVQPVLSSLFPVSDVHASRLQKTGAPKHNLVLSESLLCQKEGCLMLHLRTEAGREYLVEAAMTMQVEGIMKMACSRVHMAWESCQKQITLTHKGTKLDAAAVTSESGLRDNDVVDMKLAPVEEPAKGDEVIS